MSFLSYSQNLEDVMLWRALRHIKSGFYIDIGAWSPDLDSVTRLFYEQGWNGINIEPHPKYYAQLMEKRQNDINLNLCISDKVGHEEIHFLGESGLSTLNATIADQHKNNLGINIKKEKVEVITLKYLWSKYVSVSQQIHFLKIDVEGFEKAVLKGNDWDKNRPWIIVLEAVIPLSQIENHQDWEQILIEANYAFVYADGVNRFYVAKEHSDIISAFKYPPNVFDGFIPIKQKELEESLLQETKRAELAEFSAEQRRLDLQMIYASRSWRLTYPLRWINKIRKLIMEKGVHASFKIAIEKMKWHVKELIKASTPYNNETSYEENIIKKKIERNYYDENWYLIKNELGKSYFYSPISLIFQENIEPSESVYFNLHHAIKKYSPKGIALVFFMGMGDYLMSTPLINKIKKTYPDINLYAGISSSLDSVNSPKTKELMKGNPLINEIYEYKGVIKNYWKNYDFTDLIKKIPKNTLIVPVIHEDNEKTTHRVNTLFKTFGFEKVNDIDLNPILYENYPTNKAKKIIKMIIERTKKRKELKIVFTHFFARSSMYSYRDRNVLIKLLSDNNYYVINFSDEEIILENVYNININEISPVDTIEILRTIKNHFQKISIISVNSIMWPISAGLGIENLGLHIFNDKLIHQYFYPNIYIISRYKYDKIPNNHLIICPESESYFEKNPMEILLIHFDPKFIFNQFINLQHFMDSTH